MNPPYYGVGLLDDLHHYFPALLYEPSAFHSVQDVLSYVSAQTSRHFDRFSNARNHFRLQSSPGPSGYSNNAAPVYTAQAPWRTAPSSTAIPATPAAPPVSQAPPVPQAPPATPQRPTSLRTPITQRVPPGDSLIRALDFGATVPALGTTIPARVTTRFHDALGLSPWIMDMDLPGPLGVGDSLNTLLQVALGAAPRVPAQNFMEPVVVRPTTQQIEAASTLEEVGDVPETPCAICQDDFQTGETTRTLNACDHMFHRNCVDTWFQSNVRCPVCRHDIREPVDSSSEEDRSPDSP